MDEQRSWLETVAGPLAGASVGAVVVIALAMAGPGKYYGWRLQKVLDLLGGMEDLDGMEAQRRELHAEADRLSRLVAAIHRVPTEWRRFALWVVVYGVAALITFSGFWVLQRWGITGWWHWLGLLAIVILASPFMETTHVWWDSWKYTRRERRRFIAEGLPADFQRRHAPITPKWVIRWIPKWALAEHSETLTDSTDLHAS
ncbi:hypothetical protein [Nocardia goodfellowii]|uniref:Uncharacterized protein n=1 Tax=Nocardia goodfellowii TaxID=882446 RepID=A0ABS4Q846_9NOCA|nr:hypothetical protein [Nocardia goodfellowii]MBP2187863.1 hypothetical protein [Nocardia goodfellowii]